VAGRVEPQTATIERQATRVPLDQFIEAATRAALQAKDARGTGVQVTAVNLQTLTPEAATPTGTSIIVGIIL
jgi:electron transfer flavoprotein alpha/beta subunit